jgi:N-acetylmuramoyl-L-alanine amidase
LDVAGVRTVCTTLLAVACLLAASTHAIEIERVRLSEAPLTTRVVFDISAPARYEVRVLENPHRLVIDFDQATLGPAFDTDVVAPGLALLDRIRTGSRGNGQRIVLDLRKPVRHTVTDLAPIDPYRDRVVVDLHDVGARPVQPPKVVEPSGRRDLVVAIDAGHGGEDPGAIGPGRIQEKDVVLSIARELGRLLDGEPGYRAVLVRNGDYYLSHRVRSETGRRQRADVFVSVHADAFKRPEAAGASVYALSDKGATSETAKWLADGANRSDLIGGEGVISLSDKNDDLTRVLLNISMDSTRSRSIDLGAAILRELGGTAKLHKDRVELAAFLVLKVVDVPSVLVETGFISNPAEARRLGTREYQRNVAAAIFRGITVWANAQPIEGTLIAWQREQGTVQYRISPGDTLSGIASRYGVSTERIKAANRLTTDAIRIGQVIVIPQG